MKNKDFDPVFDVNLMTGAARTAAAALKADFAALENLTVDEKGPGDFVSRADRKSEETIVGILSDARPDWGFLGEEGTDRQGNDPRFRWIIDPLDGTNNFVHGLPHWCITIALERDGEIVAGATYDPLLDEMFHGVLGGGVFLNGLPLKRMTRKGIKNALVNIDPGHARRDAAQFAQFGKVVLAAEQHGAAVRVAGAGALDLCYLAAGRFDALFHAGGAKPWDIAAGFMFCREQGLIATTPEGDTASIHNGLFLAAEPALHKAFSELIEWKVLS